MTRWAIRAARLERGASAVEYAMIITGVAMGMVAVVGYFHESVSQLWAQAIALM